MSEKSGNLKHGLTIGTVTHKTFVMREATAADLFAAEETESSLKPIRFNAALIAQQLVSIGEFTGPFSLGLLGKLKGADLEVLQMARAELEKEGEAEQPV